MSTIDQDYLESNFEAVSAWQCKHCGDLVMTSTHEMEKHLEKCEYIDEPKDE